MKKVFLLAVAALLFCTVAIGQSAPQSTAAPAQTAPAAKSPVPPKTRFDATLTRTIDLKKATEGDVIEAKATSDIKDDMNNTVIPKNSKLLGRIVKIETSGPSAATVIFDKGVTKKGAEIPIHALVVSMTGPEEMSAGGNDSPMAAGGGGRSAGGMNAGGAGNVPSGPRPGDLAPEAPKAAANPSDARFPVKNMPARIDAEKSSTQVGTVVASTNNKPLKIESGTKMVLMTFPEQ